MMSARERLLAAENGFLVAVTRIADHATLVVDSAPDLERAVLGNSGAKTAALEVVRSGASKARTRSSIGPTETPATWRSGS